MASGPPAARRPTEAELATARSHIRHVVVLMLENRSFDHLLGFLDHPSPDFPRLQAGQHPNPFDVADPSAGEPTGVSPTAEPVLAVGPPHRHVSATIQLNGRRWRSFGMDGFVTASAQHLAGKDRVAVIHWVRILVSWLVLSPVVAAAAHDLARRAACGGWGRFGLAYLGAAAGSGALAAALRLDQVPGRRARSLVVPVLVAAVPVAAAGAGLLRWLTVSSRGFAPWTAVVAVAGAGAVWLGRRMAHRRARVEARYLATASARVMACMPPERVPVLGELARNFAVCTHWHSSVPGATWPNRNFAHAATSEESVDIEVGFYRARTIFELLDDAHPDLAPPGPEPFGTWRIYHHDTPQVIAFDRLWKDGRAKNWFDVARLYEDIAADRLPMYSFVEPRHTSQLSNSQHPENNERPTLGSTDFERGESLVADVYAALCANREVFDRTLLVVTYDEHGGLFDHEPPPRTVHPDPGRYLRSGHRFELVRRLVAFYVENRNARFDFRTLGVRVPAVVVSPRVGRGVVDPTLYDHASIVASLRLLFAPDQPPLTRRDARASTFLHLVTDTARDVEPLAGAPAPRAAPTAVDAAGEAVPEEVDRPLATGALVGDDLATQLARLRECVDLTLDEMGAVPAVEAADRAAPSPRSAAGAAPTTAERFKRWAAVHRT
jgi:phospholipase C